MKKIYQKLLISVKHLDVLHDIFLQKSNYTKEDDYALYIQNLKEFLRVSGKINFPDELYSRENRQMKLADIIEYIFFSRGIFSLIRGKNKLIKEDVPKFIELILRFVNLLMLYEIMTTDTKIRKAFLRRLKKEIPDIKNEDGFNKLLKWNDWVGLTKEENPKGAPSDYFDSILPKTAGGLWHEMLVYAFILRFDIGYIFPLLLHQKVISLDKKLSPPDLVILHKETKRYYGIEIGYLKERQTGGFMAPSGIPVIPIDTLNSRASDRCPACKKWIGLCPKVIQDFSDPNYKIKNIEVRCLYDCNRYTLKEKIEGKCPYLKYKGTLPYHSKERHYHYKCVTNEVKNNILTAISKKHKIDKKVLIKMLNNKKIKSLRFQKDNLLSKKIHRLKTHYLWYPELSGLIKK